MTQTNPRCFHQSASAISCFKACPQRYRLAYREGLRPAEDTESQRVGTNWHAMHEVYANTYCVAYKKNTLDNDAEPSDEDADIHANACARDESLAAVIEHLNQQYAEMPQTKTAFEWALEREILLRSFLGYLWYWQNDPVEVIVSEVGFELPIHAPKVGLPLPTNEVVRIGKIDQIVRWGGVVGPLERKSTSRSIAPDSDYWDKSQKDTQISMYDLACRDMQEHGLDHYNIKLRKGERFGNTLYDVWHKPTIKPKLLTQAETKAFIETGEYCGQEFAVTVDGIDPEFPVAPESVQINGEFAEIEPSKKGFAIRETVGMYGARLLADIYERPEFYFARREIARTEADRARFRIEGYNIYQTQRTMDKTGHWYENEQQCRATYPCPYIAICYGPGAEAVCDGQTTPNGYKRIFVDLKSDRESEGE